MTATIELSALELHGHHGVGEEERRRGQIFVYDVWIDVPEPRADRLDETLDYREVVAAIREISEGRQFQLLEALAAAVADALVERFRPERVRVRVRKPHVRLPVEFSAVTVTRP